MSTNEQARYTAERVRLAFEDVAKGYGWSLEMGLVAYLSSETEKLWHGFRWGVNCAATLDAPAGVVPSICDGKEQDAFEAWAKGEGFDMECHPLHWLFLNQRTYAARQGWKGALEYVNRMLTATPAPSESESESESEGGKGVDGDATRFRFVVENNWIGAKTRCAEGIQDSDIESARRAVDRAMLTAAQQASR